MKSSKDIELCTILFKLTNETNENNVFFLGISESWKASPAWRVSASIIDAFKTSPTWSVRAHGQPIGNPLPFSSGEVIKASGSHV